VHPNQLLTLWHDVTLAGVTYVVNGHIITTYRVNGAGMLDKRLTDLGVYLTIFKFQKGA
jgi:hypothetical protein